MPRDGIVVPKWRCGRDGLTLKAWRQKARMSDRLVSGCGSHRAVAAVDPVQDGRCILLCAVFPDKVAGIEHKRLRMWQGPIEHIRVVRRHNRIVTAPDAQDRGVYS